MQLGLNNSAEYLYLSEPNWERKHLSQPRLKQIPSEIARMFESWEYIGVDADVASITRMLDAYGDRGNTRWVNAYISRNENMLYCVPSYANPPSTTIQYFYGLSCTLHKLFALLNLSRVDVLTMDIEGGELEALHAYNWQIKPLFLAIEVHGRPMDVLNKNVKKIQQLLSEKGYHLYHNEYTNPNHGQYDTCEIQFIEGVTHA